MPIRFFCGRNQMLAVGSVKEFSIYSDVNCGEILLGGKCPFVRTKKLSGQKNCPDKKIVRTKKLSDKKLSGQNNCPEEKKIPDKKIFQTKKLSGQNCFCRSCQCP